MDAVISVAAFHWISDHDALFRNLASVLRPGGQFVVDCGGQGNAARIVAAIDEVLGESPAIWNFAGAEETERRLESPASPRSRWRSLPTQLDWSQARSSKSYLAEILIDGRLGI